MAVTIPKSSCQVCERRIAPNRYGGMCCHCEALTRMIDGFLVADALIAVVSDARFVDAIGRLGDTFRDNLRVAMGDSDLQGLGPAGQEPTGPDGRA